MNKIIYIMLLFLFMHQVQATDKGSVVVPGVIAAVALAARPVYNMVQEYRKKHSNTVYTLGSLLGTKLQLKQARGDKARRVSAQVSVGSADVKVVMPTIKQEKKRSVLLNLLSQDWKNIYPKLVIAVEDKVTPLVRSFVTDGSEQAKRLYAEFSCGTFRVRTGVDISEALLAPFLFGVVFMLQHYKDSLIHFLPHVQTDTV